MKKKPYHPSRGQSAEMVTKLVFGLLSTGHYTSGGPEGGVPSVVLRYSDPTDDEGEPCAVADAWKLHDAIVASTNACVNTWRHLGK